MCGFFPIPTVFTAMQSGKQKEKLNLAEKLILFNFLCHVFYDIFYFAVLFRVFFLKQNDNFSCVVHDVLQTKTAIVWNYS